MLNRVASTVLAAALLFCVIPAASASAEDLVPDVVGLQADQAKALLDQAGYPYDLSHDASKARGLVFGQTPGGLATRPKGTRITLTVGGTAPAPVGPPVAPVAPTPTEPLPIQPLPIQPMPLEPKPELPVDEPPVEGPPVEGPPVEGPPAGGPPSGALPRNPLDDLGEPPAPGDGTQPGRPIPMDPLPSAPEPAGPTPTPVRPDARIDRLPFATPLRRDGPAIPDVVGLTRAAARLKLEVWQVREELTLAVPSLVGTVVEQWPSGERTLAPGETVTIVLAVAESPSNDHRFVPDVMGKDLTVASRALVRFGFRPEMRKVRTLRPERVGRAVWQQPRRGSLAPAGSVVIVHMAVADGALAGTGTTPPVDPRPIEPADPTPVPLDPIPLDPRATDPTPRDPRPLDPRPTLPDGPPAGVPAVPPLGGPALPPAGPSRQPTPVIPPIPVKPVPVTPLRVDPPPAQPTPGLPAPGVRMDLLRPTLLSPPAGESYPRAFGATFEWTPVKGATAYDWVIEEEQPSGAWRVIDRSTLTGSRHRPDRLKKGRYRWRARASNARGPGDWSKWSRLYMY